MARVRRNLPFPYHSTGEDSLSEYVSHELKDESPPLLDFASDNVIYNTRCSRNEVCNDDKRNSWCCKEAYDGNSTLYGTDYNSKEVTDTKNPFDLESESSLLELLQAAQIEKVDTVTPKQMPPVSCNNIRDSSVGALCNDCFDTYQPTKVSQNPDLGLDADLCDLLSESANRTADSSTPKEEFSSSSSESSSAFNFKYDFSLSNVFSVSDNYGLLKDVNLPDTTNADLSTQAFCLPSSNASTFNLNFDEVSLSDLLNLPDEDLNSHNTISLKNNEIYTSDRLKSSVNANNLEKNETTGELSLSDLAENYFLNNQLSLFNSCKPESASSDLRSEYGSCETSSSTSSFLDALFENSELSCQASKGSADSGIESDNSMLDVFKVANANHFNSSADICGDTGEKDFILSGISCKANNSSYEDTPEVDLNVCVKSSYIAKENQNSFTGENDDVNLTAAYLETMNLRLPLNNSISGYVKDIALLPSEALQKQKRFRLNTKQSLLSKALSCQSMKDDIKTQKVESLKAKILQTFFPSSLCLKQKVPPHAAVRVVDRSNESIMDSPGRLSFGSGTSQAR